MGQSLKQAWDQYRLLESMQPMDTIRVKPVYTSDNNDRPAAQEDIERHAFLNKNLLQIRRLLSVYNLLNQSKEASSQNDDLILPHLVEHHLNQLQYSEDTYALIADIVRTVAFAFYTEMQNNLCEQFGTSNRDQQRDHAYARLKDLFTTQVQTIIPNFENATLLYSDDYTDSRGYTFMSPIKDFSLPYNPNNFIALHPAFEQRDKKSVFTLNTIVHELAHKLMNAIYQSLYERKDLPVPSPTLLDAWVNQNFIDGNILSAELVTNHYSVYRAIPDERLAFYAGNSFETWMRIIGAFPDDETNILADPEKREQVINLFNDIEPTIRDWSDNRDKANDTMHQFFKDLYPS